MKKIHTKAKRKFGLPRHLNPYNFFHPKKRVRQKTFRTEEAANAWASSHELKQGQYALNKVKRNKRFEVVKL